MIGKVSRGDRFGGLLVYLAGPGRSNEHTEPHLVAGDGAMLAWYGEDELDRQAALAIAHHLDRPRKVLDVEVAGGHVWHCSLSLSAEEGQLSDEKWGRIATEFVAGMGFDDNNGTKAPCRWVAVRHGLSTAGNDHVHLAVQLVREDGTKASIHHDYRRVQTVCRDLERRHGLVELEGAKAERSTRGYHAAELATAAKRDAQRQWEKTHPGQAWADLDPSTRRHLVDAQTQVEAGRYTLARTVRASATASLDEAEFVRRLRRSGALVRPRFATGRDDVVMGYSVAQRPPSGQRPIWYGGGRLGNDLTLPRLRQEWPDTPQAASAAAAEWTAARRNRRPIAPGREVGTPSPQLMAECTRDLGRLVDRLQQVPPENRAEWARVARHTAGAMAAWSAQLEEQPGPIARAADRLAVAAQTKTAELNQGGRSLQVAPLVQAAALMVVASKKGKGRAATVVLVRELVRIARVLYELHKHAGERRQAQAVLVHVRKGLEPVLVDQQREGERELGRSAEQLPVGRAPKYAGRAARGTPIPNRIETDRRPTHAGSKTDRGAPGRG